MKTGNLLVDDQQKSKINENIFNSLFMTSTGVRRNKYLYIF